MSITSSSVSYNIISGEQISQFHNISRQIRGNDLVSTRPLTSFSNLPRYSVTRHNILPRVDLQSRLYRPVARNIARHARNSVILSNFNIDSYFNDSDLSSSDEEFEDYSSVPEVTDPNPTILNETTNLTYQTYQTYLPGFPKDNFESIEHIEKLGYICTICQDIFREPKTLLCGHVFCEGCIKQALLSRQQCPICNKETNSSQLINIPIIKSYIDELIISCSNTPCTWKNKIELFKIHENDCCFKESNIILHAEIDTYVNEVD